MSVLLRYCHDNHCYTCDAECTHFAPNQPNGEKLMIPMELLKGFFDSFALDYKNGIHHCLSERVGKTFNMFYDMTFIGGDEKIDATFIKDIVGVISSVAYWLFEGKPCVDTIVTTMIESTVIVGNTTVRKVRVRAHQPWLRVDIHRASYILGAIPATFVSIYQERDVQTGANRWEDVFNTSVYEEESSIRMLFNREAIKCPDCGGAWHTLPPCQRCGDHGMIMDGTMFTPWLALRFDGIFMQDYPTLTNLLGDQGKALAYFSTRLAHSDLVRLYPADHDKVGIPRNNNNSNINNNNNNNNSNNIINNNHGSGSKIHKHQRQADTVDADDRHKPKLRQAFQVDNNK